MTIENYVRKARGIYNSTLQLLGYNKACEVYQELKEKAKEMFNIGEYEYRDIYNKANR